LLWLPYCTLVVTQVPSLSWTCSGALSPASYWERTSWGVQDVAEGVELTRPLKRPHLRQGVQGVGPVVEGVVAVLAVGEGVGAVAAVGEGVVVVVGEVAVEGEEAEVEGEGEGEGAVMPPRSALLLFKPWPLNAWMLLPPPPCYFAALTPLLSARSHSL
jgi:hypothetical protein